MTDKIKEAFEQYSFHGPEEMEVSYLDFEAGYLAKEKEAAEQEPFGYFYKDHNGSYRQAGDLQFKEAHLPLYAAPVDQSDRIAELEAEVARLKVEARDACFGLNEYYELKLAAAQAENKKLHNEVSGKDVLVSNWWANLPDTFCSAWNDLEPLKSQPSDNSALESLLEAERIKTAEACADFVHNYAEIEEDQELDTRSVALLSCAGSIRNGDWKGFVK